MKWVALLAFGSLGLAALTGGLIWLGKRYQIIRYGIETGGVVVGQEIERYERNQGRMGGTDNAVSYYPVVEFTTADGELIRFQGSSGGVDTPLIETGTQVRVVYLRSDPASAVIGDFTQSWLGPVAVSVAGVIFLAMGVGSFFLIGGVDRTMDALDERMQREFLYFDSSTIRIEATVSEIREIDGAYVLVCKGVRPGKLITEEFLSDSFPFRPDRAFIGERVSVLLDASGGTLYTVDLGTMLKDILQLEEMRKRGGL